VPAQWGGNSLCRHAAADVPGRAAAAVPSGYAAARHDARTADGHAPGAVLLLIEAICPAPACIKPASTTRAFRRVMPLLRALPQRLSFCAAAVQGPFMQHAPGHAHSHSRSSSFGGVPPGTQLRCCMLTAWAGCRQQHAAPPAESRVESPSCVLNPVCHDGREWAPSRGWRAAAAPSRRAPMTGSVTPELQDSVQACRPSAVLSFGNLATGNVPCSKHSGSCVHLLPWNNVMLSRELAWYIVVKEPELLATLPGGLHTIGITVFRKQLGRPWPCK
jgi:hypothetical protein